MGKTDLARSGSDAAGGPGGPGELDGRLPGDEPLPPRPRGAEHAALLALFVLGALVMVLLATAVEPDPRGFGTHERLGLPPCGLMALSGVPCPGCGVTTSVALFARGRPGAALATQPLGPLVALLLPAAAAWALVQHARGRDLARELAARRWRRWLTAGLLAVALAWAYKLAIVLG